MRCSKAAVQLQLYLDHRLPLEQIRALEAHISSCSACQGELFLLEEIDTALQTIEPVTEPADLTATIMRRVALSPRKRQEQVYGLLRPSLPEMVAVVLLATITTLGVILTQPSLWALLPLTNGPQALSMMFINTSHLLGSVNVSTLSWVCWVIGTLLGVVITLALAGQEMRSRWFKGMLDRLPVW